METRPTNQNRREQTNTKHIKIMYTNADSLCSKLQELKDRIQDKNPDIICITETKLESNTTDEALGLEQYNIWRKERKNRGGGGIMIMTKKELTTTEVELPTTTYAEVLAMEIKTKRSSLLVATTYIAPKTDTWSKEELKQLQQQSLDTLRNMLQRAETKSQELILTGDFNCSIDWDTLEPKYSPHITKSWNEDVLDFASDFSLHQHGNENTRARGADNPSRPDVVFTKHQDDIANITYNAPLGMSDHTVINMEYCIEGESKVSKYKGKYNYKKRDYIGLKDYLSKVEWKKDLNITDINMQYEKFMKSLKEGIDKFIPKTKQNRTCNNHKKWFNLRCVRARADKELLWKRYKRHPSAAALERYKEARNAYTRETRES